MCPRAAARGPEAFGPAEPGSGGVRPRLSRPECTASGPFFPSLSSRARARARTKECTALGVFNSTGCLRHVAAARSQSGGGACGLGTGLSGPAADHKDIMTHCLFPAASCAAAYVRLGLSFSGQGHMV